MSSSNQRQEALNNEVQSGLMAIMSKQLTFPTIYYVTNLFYTIDSSSPNEARCIIDDLFNYADDDQLQYMLRIFMREVLITVFHNNNKSSPFAQSSYSTTNSPAENLKSSTHSALAVPSDYDKKPTSPSMMNHSSTSVPTSTASISSSYSPRVPPLPVSRLGTITLSKVIDKNYDDDIDDDDDDFFFK
jgi:hypothetical protein